MGFEKQSSKGGYVGGFLQLFDWNAKSRKKLFSNKSDLPERSKQGKKSHANLPSTRFKLTDEDETPGVRESSEHSYDASSVTDEDGFGSRAPGVVAKLMGLDSLPSNPGEQQQQPYCCSPLSETRSLGDAQNQRNPGFLLHHRHHHGDIPKTPPQTGFHRRPMERFRTETLPPKSAKSIPVTHHKLLSPIKNPSFHTAKNAEQIMEAAVKIIEQRPAEAARTTMKKTHVVAPPSPAPLKVRKPARRTLAPADSNASRLLKGQSMNKSWSGSEDAPSRNAEEKKRDGKSVSLAIQAKVNVRNRGASPASSLSSAAPSVSALRENHQKQNSCRVELKPPPPPPSRRRKVTSSGRTEPKKTTAMQRKKRSIGEHPNSNKHTKINGSTDDYKGGGGPMEVVSFTFTSPMAPRPEILDSEAAPPLAEKPPSSFRADNSQCSPVSILEGGESCTSSESSSSSSETAVRESDDDGVRRVVCGGGGGSILAVFEEYSVKGATDVLRRYVFREGRRDLLLLDCVVECLETRWSTACAAAGSAVWGRTAEAVGGGNTSVADQVSADLCGLRRMRECMVDELVDRDMTGCSGCGGGRWLDFNLESYELASDVADQILDSLLLDHVFSSPHFLLLQLLQNEDVP